MSEPSSHHSDRRPLVVWRFNDSLRGHENQTGGLLEALARRTAVEAHAINAPRGAAQLGLAARLLLGGDFRHLPDPDLLVGAGHATHLPLLTARRSRGGRAVVVMSPSLPAAWYDLVICPNHDRIPGRGNVIVTRGALNRAPIGTEKHEDEGLVLIGGPDRYYGWSDADLFEQIETVTRGSPGIRWSAASSRRTPPGLLARLDDLGLDNVTTFAEDDVDVDWLPRQLGTAATVWVTEDSVSMIHEAITAGARTGLLAVPRLESPDASAHRWFDEGVGTLVADAMVTSFADWEKGKALAPPAVALDEARRCADWILREWFPAQQ